MFAEWIPGYVYGPNVAFEELQEFINFCIDTRMPKTNNIIHKDPTFKKILILRYIRIWIHRKKPPLFSQGQSIAKLKSKNINQIQKYSSFKIEIAASISLKR